MKCIDCNKLLPFFQFRLTRCKDCEKERMDKWVRDHTFRFNERILVHDDDEFYGTSLKGVIIKKLEKIEGAWGYYSTWTEYRVKFDDGKICDYKPEYLEKIKEGKKRRKRKKQL